MRRECRDEQRLGQTRHADEQDVAPAEESDEQFLDDGVLADDHFAQFAFEFLVPALEFFDGGKLLGRKITRLGFNDPDLLSHFLYSCTTKPTTVTGPGETEAHFARPSP